MEIWQSLSFSDLLPDLLYVVSAYAGWNSTNDDNTLLNTTLKQILTEKGADY